MPCLKSWNSSYNEPDVSLKLSIQSSIVRSQFISLACQKYLLLAGYLMNLAFFQSYQVCFYSLAECMLNGYIKDFMVMIWKYSDNDWVKHPGMTDNLSLGYLQGQQTHRPKGSVLSSVKSPCSSEAEATLHGPLVWHQFTYFLYKCTTSLKEVLFKYFHIPISGRFFKNAFKE